MGFAHLSPCTWAEGQGRMHPRFEFSYLHPFLLLILSDADPFALKSSVLGQLKVLISGEQKRSDPKHREAEDKAFHGNVVITGNHPFVEGGLECAIPPD